MNKYDEFILDLVAICKKHGVVICPSDNDFLYVWNQPIFDENEITKRFADHTNE